MTVKSDKWIRSMCQKRTGVVRHGDRRMRDAGEFYYVTVTALYGTTEAEKAVEIRAAVGDSAFDEHEYICEQDAPSDNFKPMISPYVPGQVKTRTVDLTFGHSLERPFNGPTKREERIISYGTSSMGYDVRLDRKFKIFTNVKSALIDPLAMSNDCYVDHEGDFCIIPPNSYILGHTVETFDIPRDVMVVCLGKSTYARCGAIVNVTPIEPGFKGTVVIEISNSTPLPLKVYAGQGIAQFLFFQSDEECAVSYADRGGKYQGQSGLQTALV